MPLNNFRFFKQIEKDEATPKLLRQWLSKKFIENNDLTHLIFDNPLTLNHVIKQTKKAKRQTFEKFRDSYFRSDIQKQNFPKQTVVHIGSEIGNGVFAEESILPNTFLGEYTGIIRKYEPSLDKSNPFLVRYPIKLNLFCPLIIDASRCGNYTRFYNHSDCPNAQLISVICDGVFRMVVTSVKRIENQSQILIDYGKLYWKQMGKKPNDF